MSRFSAFDSFMDDMSDMFDFFGPPECRSGSFAASLREAQSEIRETHDELRKVGKDLLGDLRQISLEEIRHTDTGTEIVLDVPGCSRENISVEVTNRKLTVTASAPTEAHRSFNLKRSYRVAEGVLPEHITATVKDGVLKVQIAKAPEVDPPASKKIPVQ